MTETGWFDAVEDNIIYKPGKYTLKGDYAQGLLEKYKNYVLTLKDDPESFGDILAAAKRAIASSEKSMQNPSTATKERAPSRNKKDEEREIRGRLQEASSNVEFFVLEYGRDFDTLSESQITEKAKEIYKERIKSAAEQYAKLPENQKDSPAGRRYKTALATSEAEYVQRELTNFFEYKEAFNELDTFLGRELSYPEITENTSTTSSPTPSDPAPKKAKPAPEAPKTATGPQILGLSTWASPPTEAQRRALEDYASGELADSGNTYLRTGDLPAPYAREEGEPDSSADLKAQLREEVEQQIQELSSAFENAALNEDVTVYRSLEDPSFNFVYNLELNEGESLDLSYLEGTTYVDKGFMSTSKTTKFAFDARNFPIRFIIKAKAGQKAIDLQGATRFDALAREEEIIFPPSAKFKISKAYYDGSRYYLEMDYLDADSKDNAPAPETKPTAAASSASGKKYDLSGISWTSTKRTTDLSDPSDTRSWKELQDVKSQISEAMYYSSSTSQDLFQERAVREYHTELKTLFDLRSLNLKSTEEDIAIQGYKTRYIESLAKIFEMQKDSAVRNRTVYRAPNYRPDGILSAIEVAKLMQPFRQFESSQDLGSLSRGTNDQLIARLEKAIEREAPELDERFISNLPGAWRVSEKSAYIKAIKRQSDTNIDAYYFDSNSPIFAYGNSVRDALTSAEDIEEFKKYAYANLLKAKSGAPLLKSAFREIVDNRGNTIRVYRNPKSKDVGNTTASNENLKTAAESFSAIADRVGTDKLPLTISFTSPSNITPIGIDSSRSDELGWAVPSAGGHVIVSRHIGKAKPGRTYDPKTSYNSVVAQTDEEYIKHTIIHELGHVVMYKHWGNDTVGNRGEKELKAAYTNLGIQITSGEDRVSGYGAGDIMEHFAEAYARYIMTGDASPKFLELLRSKGLLKSQKES